MAFVTNLSMSLIREAVLEEQLRYEIDGDGDLHISLARRKGKDLEFYVFDSAAKIGVLSMTCQVFRYFSQDEFARLMFFCNQWNRDNRIPKAYVSEPDKDGDYYARLMHAVFCSDGVHRELVRENISIFVNASTRFWNELDEVF